MGSKVVTDKDILYSLKHITNLEEGDERPSRENNKTTSSLHLHKESDYNAVADPELELKGGGGGGVALIYFPVWPFSLQSFLLFLNQNKGGRRPPWAPPLDQPLQ